MSIMEVDLDSDPASLEADAGGGAGELGPLGPRGGPLGGTKEAANSMSGRNKQTLLFDVFYAYCSKTTRI